MFGISFSRAGPKESVTAAGSSVESKPSRRAVLQAGVVGLAALVGLSRPEVSVAQLGGRPINNYLNLSGVIRNPVPYVRPSFFPYNNRINTYPSSTYFGNYFYGFGSNSYPFYYNQFLSRPNNSLYYSNNFRGSSNNSRDYSNNFRGSSSRSQEQVQSRSNRGQNNCCCQITKECAVPESPGLVKLNFEHLIPETKAEKDALEILYTDTVKSLVRNGYSPMRNEQGEEVNRPEDLLRYLTPIVFVHDLDKPKIIESIEEGFQTGSPGVRKKLIETYGSLEFFRDVVTVIRFQKLKAESIELYKQMKPYEDKALAEDIDPLIRDGYRIITAMEDTQRRDRKIKGDAGIERKITIGDIPQKAAFMTLAYNRLDDDQLKVIWDALTKISSEDNSDRASITLEQQLYIEQFMTLDTPKTNSSPNRVTTIHPNSFLYYIRALNYLHRRDEDVQGRQIPAKIEGFINEEEAKAQQAKAAGQKTSYISNIPELIKPSLSVPGLIHVLHAS